MLAFAAYFAPFLLPAIPAAYIAARMIRRR